MQNLWDQHKFLSKAWGAFHSTKIPVWNFGNSMCPMEWYILAAQIRPKPGCKRIVLETAIFPNGKGHFRRTNWNDWGGSKWSTFKAGPKYSGQTEPKWSTTLIWFLTKISRILGWMESAPQVPICYPPICHKAIGAAPGYGSKVWNIKSYSSSGGGGGTPLLKWSKQVCATQQGMVFRFLRI